MDLEREHPLPDAQAVPLNPDLAEEAGAVLARAFHDDPIQSAIFPDPGRRATLLPIVFRAFIRAAIASGGHVTATSDRRAVSIWSPPGTEIGASTILRNYGRDLPRIVIGTPLRSIRATISLFGLMERKRRTLMPAAYWYLATLGVDPPYQGRGLGTLLVTEGLDRTDADHTPAYLETETESNVAFYQQLGFGVVEELTIERLGIPLWLMARDAR